MTQASSEELLRMFVGLTAGGVVTLLAILVGAAIYDRRRAKKNTRSLQEFADSQEWPR